MSVPESIKKAAEEAEAALEQLAAQAQAQSQAAEVETARAVDEALAATSPTPIRTSAQTQPTGEDLWRQRYDTLRGKYDAEVERLRKELAERDRQLAEMREAIIRLDERVRSSEADASVPDPEQEPFTDADRNLLGEFDPVIGRKISNAIRVALGQVGQAIAQIDARLKQLEIADKALHERSQVLQVQTLIQQLDQKVPSWRQINQMPEFLTWLDAVDPYSAKPRRELFASAWWAGDADRVAQFFNGFAAEARIADTARGRPQAPPPVIPPAPAFNVGAFAAPRSAPAAAPASAPVQPVLTDDAVRALFDPRRKMSREQEKALVQRVIGTLQG